MKRRDLMAWAAIGGVGLVAGPARAQSLTWEEVAGPNGRYRLEMPKGYRHSTVPQAGQGTRQSYLVELGGNFAMELMIYDYEQNDQDRPPDDLYSQLLAAESLVKRRWPGARVLEQKDLQLGPAQGRGFAPFPALASSPSSDGPRHERRRRLPREQTRSLLACVLPCFFSFLTAGEIACLFFFTLFPSLYFYFVGGRPKVSVQLAGGYPLPGLTLSLLTPTPLIVFPACSWFLALRP